MNWRYSTGNEHNRYNNYGGSNRGTNNDRRQGYSDQRSSSHFSTSRQYNQQSVGPPQPTRFKRFIPTPHESNNITRNQQLHHQLVSVGDIQQHQQPYPQNQQSYRGSYAYPTAAYASATQPNAFPSQNSNALYGLTSPSYATNAFRPAPTQRLAAPQQPLPAAVPPTLQLTAKPPSTSAAVPATINTTTFDPAKFDSRLDNQQLCLRLMELSSLNFYLRNEPPPQAAAAAGVFARPPPADCIVQLVDVAKKKGIFDDLRAGCNDQLKSSPFFEKLVNRVQEEARMFLRGVKFHPALEKRTEFERLKRHIAKKTQASQQVSQVLEGMPRHLLSRKGTTIHGSSSSLPKNDNDDKESYHPTSTAIHERLYQLVSTTLREKYPARSQPVPRISAKRHRSTMSFFEDAAESAEFMPTGQVDDDDFNTPTALKRLKTDELDQQPQGCAGRRTSPSTGAVFDNDNQQPASVMSNQSVIMTDELAEEPSTGSGGGNMMDIVDDGDDEAVNMTLTKKEEALEGQVKIEQGHAATPVPTAASESEELHASAVENGPSNDTASDLETISATTIVADDVPAEKLEFGTSTFVETQEHISSPVNAEYALECSAPPDNETVTPPTVTDKFPSPLHPLVQQMAKEAVKNVHGSASPNLYGDDSCLFTASAAGDEVNGSNLSNFEDIAARSDDANVIGSGAVNDDDAEKVSLVLRKADVSQQNSPTVESLPVVKNKRGRKPSKPPVVTSSGDDKTDDVEIEPEQDQAVVAAPSDTSVERAGTRRMRRINVRYTSNEFITNIPGLRKKPVAKKVVKSKRC